MVCFIVKEKSLDEHLFFAVFFINKNKIETQMFLFKIGAIFLKKDHVQDTFLVFFRPDFFSVMNETKKNEYL